MRSLAPVLRAFAIFMLAFGLLPSAAHAQSLKVKGLLIFGDSLVDTGNVFIGSAAAQLDPAVPPSVSPHRTYFNGRFSNGPVSVEYLWQLLTGFAPGTPRGVQPILADPQIGTFRAVNFAFGGTGTPEVDVTPGGIEAPGLLGQVELARVALNGKKLAKDTLCVVATGANDYRDDPFNTPMDPSEVVQNIIIGLFQLYDDVGCRNAIVFDLPDLSLLPELDPENDNDAAEYGLYVYHNSLLGGGLAILKALRPDYNLIRFDISTLLPVLQAQNFNVSTPALDLIYNPAIHPVPPSVCLFVNPAFCPDVDLGLAAFENHAYYDIVHPTTTLQRFIGESLYALIQ